MGELELRRQKARPEDWRPVVVDSLESNAFCVVRSTKNSAVTAGPGAGKTELLAQRAAYLFQTGICRAPQRILAISFKRDAASNLSARVRERCHPAHSARFDSMTFDAFCKSLLDRFRQALPDLWRPSPDYQVVYPTDRDYMEFLSSEVAAPPNTFGSSARPHSVGIGQLKQIAFWGAPLPAEGWTDPSLEEWVASEFWRTSLQNRPNSRLSFPMIGRLAGLLLTVNPAAMECLRLTYSHLFMDEFQDTTQIQYDLVRAIFSKTSTVVTAVGDRKQQIMRWAMAMVDPFSVFVGDFDAETFELYFNYRSSPELVRIQHVLAQSLESHSLAAVSRMRGTVIGESCSIWDFSSTEIEAQSLAAFIKSESIQNQLSPRDVVILVRQKAYRYEEVLAPHFGLEGISLRNEARTVGDVPLQDLLTESFSSLLVGLLRLATMKTAGGYWCECNRTLSWLHRIPADDETSQARLSQELNSYVSRLSKVYSEPPKTETAAKAVVADVLTFIDKERLISCHPAYSQGRWLEKVVNASALHLLEVSRQANNWKVALDTYEGIHSIPLMTIHKSKGLEYHTVIFVGLDDQAWWSFERDQLEATAGFFVAFTRAKQRVIFTYCGHRGAREKISPLYDLLVRSGVQIRTVG